MIRSASTIRWLFAFIAVFGPSVAHAQADDAIPARTLTEPWVATRAVVLSFTEIISEVGDIGRRSEIDRDLGQLEDRLSELATRQQSIAISIASNPGFAYNAATAAEEMAAQVAAIGQSFDTLSIELTVHDRTDVKAAHESIAALQRALAERNAVEREVINAIASGGRNQIQALAGKWWDGSESVSTAEAAVVQVRRPLSATK